MGGQRRWLGRVGSRQEGGGNAPAPAPPLAAARRGAALRLQQLPGLAGEDASSSSTLLGRMPSQADLKGAGGIMIHVRFWCTEQYDDKNSSDKSVA